jgi:hypothetical protein
VSQTYCGESTSSLWRIVNFSVNLVKSLSSRFWIFLLLNGRVFQVMCILSIIFHWGCKSIKEIACDVMFVNVIEHQHRISSMRRVGIECCFWSIREVWCSNCDLRSWIM